MAKRSTKSTKARTRSASATGDIRGRVRDETVNAFRDQNLSLSDIPRFINNMLDSAVSGIDASIPQSKKNVLREVFDGLQEGVHSVASTGSAAAKDIRDRSRSTAKNASSATSRVRAANEDFLDAVRGFAGKASKEVRDELKSLADRAQGLRPKVSGSARRIADATDGRLMELGGETIRAGGRAARRAAGAVALGASGFFEGLAESLTSRKAPPTRAPQGKKTKKSRAKKTAKRRKP